MSRVVITGAFGYVGLACLHRLAGEADLVAVGHPPRAVAAIPAGIERFEGDLGLAVGQLAAGGVDAVIHLAGGGGEAKVREEPVAAVRSIVHGTATVADAARRAGTRRRLYASTIAIYGTDRDHGRPYAETDQPLPDDLYGSLKHAAEHVWTQLAGGTALRIANIYGAGAGVDLGINGAAERFARAAARGEEITVYGDGSQRIDYVHIDDVVDAFRRALASPNPLPPAINIGSGRPVAIRELAEACVRAGARRGKTPKLTFLPAPAGKIWPDRSLSIDLAREALGWEPRVPLDDGVGGLVEMMMTT
jgi:UDP-glucose 4-epimerase